MNEICLSTTEAEYICLSEALRTTIVIMRFHKELQGQMKGFKALAPTVKCRTFEDNSGTLELAKSNRMRPRTKHINIKYHHFRPHVNRREILIEKIDTKEQLADLGTKPLSKTLIPLLEKEASRVVDPLSTCITIRGSVGISASGGKISKSKSSSRSREDLL